MSSSQELMVLKRGQTAMLFDINTHPIDTSTHYYTTTLYHTAP